MPQQKGGVLVVIKPYIKPKTPRYKTFNWVSELSFPREAFFHVLNVKSPRPWSPSRGNDLGAPPKARRLGFAAPEPPENMYLKQIKTY